eukprot:CAMPEP_0177391586 /NCGR_PEP_ID=MMETSP0368-20130122/53866_1 /TAXON_ID=447022 ORGANISM="Scrippsiella hangoei-like, Strain SHHI-4" /NCGR_SAMPLE_ID=MMETSP0368 /ASSEMBLY_ACC=CAM_ASM_000363 /LENGTH=38 /DNA_ID= /DNA_START= /DNA_END= /DNA_ORIENTATION=
MAANAEWQAWATPQVFLLAGASQTLVQRFAETTMGNLL